MSFVKFRKITRRKNPRNQKSLNLDQDLRKNGRIREKFLNKKIAKNQF